MARLLTATDVVLVGKNPNPHISDSFSNPNPPITLARPLTSKVVVPVGRNPTPPISGKRMLSSVETLPLPKREPEIPPIQNKSDSSDSALSSSLVSLSTLFIEDQPCQSQSI